MSTSRALITTVTPAQALLDKISKFNSFYDQHRDGMISLQELSGIPTFREIIMSRAFAAVRRTHPEIDVYEMKERDVELQNYILGRFLNEIKDCRTDLQRSREYVHVMRTFDRYGIDSSDYMARIEDKSARYEAGDLIKRGAASYVKSILARNYYSLEMKKEDMDLLQSSGPSRPNDKLEALLRPFEEAVTYNPKTRDYTKPQWFELLGILEQAGYDFDEPGLAEAIMPDNAYVNAVMALQEAQNAGTAPA